MTSESRQDGVAVESIPVPAVTLSARLAGAFRKYMLFVAVFGNGIFYIQAGRIFANGSANDVSAAAFGVSFWAVSSWFLYGLILRDRVIIIANIIAMIGAALVLVGCWIHS
jgi:MtN3 and saliva related transmembrane protein